MQRWVSRSAAFAMVMSGVKAPPRTMGAWRLTSEAMLPRVTAPKRRYVTSAEHRKETRLPTSTALRKRAGSWPMHPDRDRLQSAASTWGIYAFGVFRFVESTPRAREEGGSEGADRHDDILSCVFIKRGSMCT